MGRRIIDAYRKLRLVKDKAGDYSLVQVLKYGESDTFNALFRKHHSCKVSEIGPVGEMYGYTGYLIHYKNAEERNGVILFGTRTDLAPWGIGKATNSNDALIFRKEDDTIEIYICPEMYAQAAQLLMSVQDGTRGLRKEIEFIQEQISKGK